MKNKHRLVIILLMPVLMILYCSDARAQSEWLDYGTGNSVSIEIYKPITPRDSNKYEPGGIEPGFTVPSVAVYLTGRYNLYKDFTLVGEFPFAYGAYDTTNFVVDESGAKIGNPYLGAEYRVPKSPLMFELGLRLPLSPDNPVIPSLVGFAADIDRSEAFLRDVVPVYTAVNYESLSESNIYLRGRGGVNIWFNTKKIPGFDTQPEVTFDYTLQVGYFQKYVHVIAGVVGKYDVDSGPLSSNKNNLVQYGILITGIYKNIRPALSFKVPGGNAGLVFNYIIGLNCTYEF